jgi:hypothetical protein
VGFFWALAFIGYITDAARESATRNVARRLVGQTTPHFTFSGADDPLVTDSTLKGSVYVLDFWPSIKSLTGLDRFCQKHSNDGLKVFAVFPEHIPNGFGAFQLPIPSGQSVMQFVNSRSVCIHVVTYGGDWNFPEFSISDATGHETVVIGRDGKIIKVLFDTNYEGEIEDAVLNDSVMGSGHDLAQAWKLQALTEDGQQSSEDFVNSGNAKSNKSDWDGAIADFTKAIELKPEYADAYNDRGSAKQLKGDLNGAIADFTRAIELNPKDADAYVNRGNAKKAKWDQVGADEDFAQAAKLGWR